MTLLVLMLASLAGAVSLDAAFRERLRENEARVRAHLAPAGGRLLSMRWARFGLGWFAARGDLHVVEYADEGGKRIGVVLSEDQVVGASGAARSVS